MIKPILIALVMASTPVVAAPYDDTVTFSASAVCSVLTGVKYPSKTNDKDWKSYLQCIQVMHYFNTKY